MCLLPLTAAAQSDETGKTLEKIGKKNEGRNAFSGRFTQTKRLVSKKEIKSEGMLHFNAPDKLAMLYDKPEGDQFIINADKMLVDREGKSNRFDLAKNKSMNTLAVTILYSLQGKVSELAEICNADIEASSKGSGWQITLTAKTKAAKGYSEIVLDYKADGSLASMKMTEFSGICTIYEMDSVTPGASDESLFQIRASSQSKRDE